MTSIIYHCSHLTRTFALLSCPLQAIVPGSAFLCAADEMRVRFSCARPRLAELRLALDVLELALAEWTQPAAQ